LELACETSKIIHPLTRPNSTAITTTLIEDNNGFCSTESKSVELRYEISIIIPVYNEESKISALLAGIREMFAESKLAYELILINDGSTDKTVHLIQKEEKLDKRIKVLSYEQNRGKGYAVKMGVLNSRGDLVLLLDGDLDISPTQIRNYVKEIDGWDLVIASKTHPLSIVTAPVIRKLLSKLFSLLVRLAVGIKIKDTQSGLKVGNGVALRRIFEIMLVKRYAFDVELIAIATRLNLKIKELPINLTLDSSFNIREIAKMFIDVLGISYKVRIARLYQKSLGVDSCKLTKSDSIASNVESVC
jgi:glycosyltransferase involved in cell wall biosynthesis